MTTSAQAPNLSGALSELRQRVSKLERLLSDPSGLGRPDTVFDLAGGLYASTSVPYPVPQRRKYWEAQIEIGTWTAPTGSITVSIRVSGLVVKTLTVPSGSTSTSFPIDVVVNRNQRLSVSISGAGGDASDIVISLRY